VEEGTGQGDLERVVSHGHEPGRGGKGIGKWAGSNVDPNHRWRGGYPLVLEGPRESGGMGTMQSAKAGYRRMCAVVGGVK